MSSAPALGRGARAHAHIAVRSGRASTTTHRRPSSALPMRSTQRGRRGGRGRTSGNLLLLRWSRRFVCSFALQTQDPQSLNPKVCAVKRLAKDNRNTAQDVQRLDGQRQDPIGGLRSRCDLHLVSRTTRTTTVPCIGSEVCRRSWSLTNMRWRKGRRRGAATKVASWRAGR